MNSEWTCKCDSIYPYRVKQCTNEECRTQFDYMGVGEESNPEIFKVKGQQWTNYKQYLSEEQASKVGDILEFGVTYEKTADISKLKEALQHTIHFVPTFAGRMIFKRG